MEVKSRTAKSIRNSVFAFVVFGINILLNFISRKVFLDNLGNEVVGLNTTALNLLQFLNIAELGIATAVGFTLYKPLYDDNRRAINEIVTLQGHLYRIVAGFIIFGSCVLMAFFPRIFDKMELPLWYAYASFGVLLFSALLGYFVNYRQILLSANQQDYKIVYSYRSVMLLKVVCQILTIHYLENGYVWWLACEVVFAIIGSVSLTIVTRRTFPYLRRSSLRFRELYRKYSTFVTKIKQLFFHKLAKNLLMQSSPVIIYAFADLTLVAKYGNYLILTMGVIAFVGAISNNLASGIGNLVAEGNQEKIRSVFRELLGVRFLLTTTICFTLMEVTPQLIDVWIGAEYNLSTTTLTLIICSLYINLSCYTVDAFKDAFGLFRDIWAPVTEAILNIGLSVLLGYFYGLNGILSGVLISQVVIILGWRPYFLMKSHMQGYFLKYHLLYIKQIALCAVVWFVCDRLLALVPALSVPTFPMMLLHALVCLLLFAPLLYLLLCVGHAGLDLFHSRVRAMLTRR